jgi:hypothetical protein
LLLVAAGFFLWKSQAEQENPVPPAPQAVAAEGSAKVEEPPQATEKSKEEKRFARADKDDDGRITLEELYQPRRKAFAKLDKNGDSRLTFEEWAISTGEKFAGADKDRSGWLSPKEYETTRPKVKAKPKRCAC